VTPDRDGANVAVWAPDAAAVELCLFGDEPGEERVALPYRDGGIWHAHVEGVGPGDRYGLRAYGEYDPHQGKRFNHHKLLIDPYARGLDAPVRFDPLMPGAAAGPGGELALEADGSAALDTRDSASVVPKGMVQGPAPGEDPAANRPHHAMADLVIYEAHVKGISAAHPDVPEELRGTYAGMAHPAVVNHLVGLGVTAVELLPIQAFLDDAHLVSAGLSNYWGYQPIAWCAPEPRYAHRDADAEVRHLVHTLHAAGIEVILDVVYNHSAEGDERGPMLGPRGLHNAGYYRLLDEGHHYINDTGTGNTLAVERPMVLRLVLDSLRHWVQRYGVDGFRFDLAAAVGRTRRGFNPHGAFFQAIRQDPVLAGVKLIAEPWDIGPGGYQLGHFPHPWSEWNDRFRDGVRRVWRGEPLGNMDFGSLLLGSSELFDHGGRGPTSSLNFITAHDGFTLADLVSYAGKHNEANGEENRDGHDENYSDNLGVEGPTDDPDILENRGRRARGLLAILLLAQGVPMLLGGDELGNSQGGNNNAYAQDNEIGWLDWAGADTELTDTVRRLIALRRSHPVLRQRVFLHGGERADGRRDVVWRRPDGVEPSAEDWHSPRSVAGSVQLLGAAGDPVGEELDDELVLLLAVGPDVAIALPEGAWRVELDTARPQLRDVVVTGEYEALGQSVVVLAPAAP